MAALDAAVAITERERTRRCRDDLHLDVPRVGQVRLGEQRRVTEPEFGLGGALPVGVVNLLGDVDDSHAATTAARQRLDHDRAALGLGECADIVDAGGPVDRR